MIGDRNHDSPITHHKSGMTLALLFPGQGSQFVGMGKGLCEGSAVARTVFEEAERVLGFPLSRLCFEGPDEELKLTVNTQPAILTHSVAAYRELAASSPERLEGATFCAGHSLGEYSAAVAAGALTFADALRLVRERGRFMQEAVPPGVGAMAAILDSLPRTSRPPAARPLRGKSSRPPTTTRPSKL